MTPELALALVFTCGWVPLWVFRTESLPDALPSYRGSERIWVRLAPTVIVVHVSLACVTVSVTPNIPRWRVLLSVALFLVGAAFWLWARSMIGPLRRRRLPEEPPQQFRQDGAFGVVRNPLYLGVLIAAGAPVLAAGRPLLLVTYGICVIALAVRAVQDEERLHRQLGSRYAEYCRAVKRLIPFVW